MMARMRQVPRLLTVWLLLAGCGLVDYQAANAQGGPDPHVGNEAVSIPLGNRDVEAYLVPNQRALVLNRYDDRGHALLKSSLPVVGWPTILSPDIVIVEFDASVGPEGIDKQLESFLRRGVIEEVAYVAHTEPNDKQQPFLLGNSATIYLSEGADAKSLADRANELGYKLESRSWGRAGVYRLLPLNPMQRPTDTVDAVKRLAEQGLVDAGKTRMNLVETERAKSR